MACFRKMTTVCMVWLVHPCLVPCHPELGELSSLMLSKPWLAKVSKGLGFSLVAL